MCGHTLLFTRTPGPVRGRGGALDPKGAGPVQGRLPRQRARGERREGCHNGGTMEVDLVGWEI
jgi:hypothetical protein